jgi:hypothetical protein
MSENAIVPVLEENDTTSDVQMRETTSRLKRILNTGSRQRVSEIDVGDMVETMKSRLIIKDMVNQVNSSAPTNINDVVGFLEITCVDMTESTLKYLRRILTENPKVSFHQAILALHGTDEYRTIDVTDVRCLLSMKDRDVVCAFLLKN